MTGRSAKPYTLTTSAAYALPAISDDLGIYATWMRSHCVEENIITTLAHGLEWRARLLVWLGAAFPERMALAVIGVDPALIFSRVMATAYIGLIGASPSGPFEVQDVVPSWSDDMAALVFTAFREVWASAERGEIEGTAFLEFAAAPIAFPGGAVTLHDYNPMVGLRATTLRFINGVTYSGNGYHCLEDSILSQRPVENRMIRI
ncbi:hypothetical protein [Polymorphobacter megasporae]|uniref:hypothetical protein n=1 Tax=Glacieibacterium megasporae TaxID=2835787 RepID=UPI001C1E6E45|nr:hypothetical protein [Polymorphobacter megasporae]UAJ11072.1 hypothetical protein KTC28_05005 [Polymorphobacter megasporae]